MIERGRQNRAYGERGGLAKLSDVDVVEMRKLAAEGWPIARIIELYPVSHTAAGQAVKGLSFPHLPNAVTSPKKAPIPGPRPGSGRKLSQEQVIEIKLGISHGNNIRRIADQFKISKSTVEAIKYGRIWGHV